MKTQDLRFKLFLLLPYLTATVFSCAYYFLLPILFPKIGDGWNESSHTIWAAIRFLGILGGPIITVLTYSLHVVVQVKTRCKEECKNFAWMTMLLQLQPGIIVIIAVVALVFGLKSYFSLELKEKCE